MICCVCSVDNSKYKCPKCFNNYCSVSCCKHHKEVCKPAKVELDSVEKGKESKKISHDYEYETDDTVPVEKLLLLEQSNALKACLRNPHLRKLLTHLESSHNPTLLMKKLMQEPIFTEFADECLKIVEPDDKR